MSILLILVITFIGSFASYFLKRSTGSFVFIIKSPYFYLGGFLYLAAAIVNVIILKKIDYSIVLPMTSLTYIWTLFISHYFLGEEIHLLQKIGIVLIVSGAFIIWI